MGWLLPWAPGAGKGWAVSASWEHLVACRCLRVTVFHKRDPGGFCSEVLVVLGRGNRGIPDSGVSPLRAGQGWSPSKDPAAQPG